MDRTFTVTFGTGDSDRIWADVRELSWVDLCRLLTEHTEGGKRGPCVVPARFRGQRRTQAEADEIGVAMLDADCGHTLEEIEAAVRDRGWAAVIHSTHSHLKTHTRANRARWEAFRDDCPIVAEEYFRRTKGYLPHVARGARVTETATKEVVFEHAPCPKFRIAMPLARPWRAADFKNQKAANAAWKERVEALAAALGLHHDQSCTDTSRLFYLPRHAPGAPFETRIVEGDDCDLWSLTAATERHTDRPGHQPDLSIGSAARIEVKSRSGGKTFDLTRWAADLGGRFGLADALQARSPNVLTGHVADNVKIHIHCVDDDRHTDPGPDNATFVVNADRSDTGGFVYHCRHAHCEGLDRLHFVRRMIERGWLDIQDLKDPDFLVPIDEGDTDEQPSFDECRDAADDLQRESGPAAVNEVLLLVHQAQLDPVSRRMILESIKDRTGLPLGELRSGLAAIRSGQDGPLEDIGLKVAKTTLEHHFARGDHLVRGVDKCFWAYLGTHWMRLTDEQVLNRVIQVVERIVDPEDGSYRTIADAAFKLLTGLRALPGDVLRLTEEAPPVINCRNGELWISADGSVWLQPHRATSYLTYVLDAAYDPSATCPRFDRALLDIFANASDPDDMARHVMEFFGYAIQPRRDIACYFLLRGRGSNGKTKLIQTLEHLVNKRAIYSDRIANIEADKFAVGSLAGKLLLLDDDVDTDTLLPDGFLKKVSERKVMSGQLKFKDAFEFVATCLPIMLANNYPRCADLSWGQRRRAKIIPFDRIFTPDDKDDRLFPYIWAHEMPGVLNRAIEGLQRLHRRGDFEEPADCRAALAEWLAHANPLAGFIAERCHPDLASRVPLGEFYLLFRAWAEECGIRNIPARNTMKRNLENLHYRVEHSRAGSMVVGLHVEGSWYTAQSAA